jgi:L,D-transpeptidase ErfK/SrfK
LIIVGLISLSLIAFSIVGAAPPPQPTPERLGRVLGQPSADLVAPGDTLLDIAFRNQVGFEALQNLNPAVDTWIPDPGTVIQLPSQVIVPLVPSAEGLLINIPEMRLFDFSVANGPKVIAAAVGDAEDPTPTGIFQVRDKRIDPVWYVPQSIREEKPELPEQVAAGPDNPLGSRWMRIGNSSYGIHGTNIRWSIGRESTHGCVRLYENEIQQLFERTSDGTRLEIIYQPYKWGRSGHQILLEAHPDRYDRIPDRLAAALSPIRELGLLDRIDIDRVWQVIHQSRGIPVVVGALPLEEAP